MQVAYYQSSNQLAVFLNTHEAKRLDPKGDGRFRAEITPTPIPGTFKVAVIPSDSGNPFSQLNSGWYRSCWTRKSTRQSGVDLLSPRGQAAPNVGSEAWGPDGSLVCEISYKQSASSVPALVTTTPSGTQVVQNTDDLGRVLAQMSAHGLKGRVTAITVEVA